MVKQAFDHVRYWVFDLDNTLYPPEAKLFDQIEVLMTELLLEHVRHNIGRPDAGT
jgi:putative hydrolase of the HAD superfamily